MSLTSRFVRLRQFFQDVYDLPCVATRITANYIPEGQSRAKYRRRTRTTWYPDQQSPIDLLAGGELTPLRRTNSIHHHNRNHGQNHIPDSCAPLAYINGHSDARSRSPPYDEHRSRYPIYPHSYAPEYTAQPLLYPSIRPQPPPGVGIHSSSANVADQGHGQPEMQQARLVYMVAPSPPRPFMPPPPDQVHTPGSSYPHPTSRPSAVYPA
jgi:hypothetical protein